MIFYFSPSHLKPVQIQLVQNFVECEKHHQQIRAQRTPDGRVRHVISKLTRPFRTTREMAKGCKRHHKCFQDRYRTYNAQCNNLKNPLYGAAFTAFKRLLPPVYDDNLFNLKENNLPNARKISKDVIRNDEEHPVRNSAENTIFLMQWGQFLDHDITFTMPNPNPIARFTSPRLWCENTEWFY